MKNFKQIQLQLIEQIQEDLEILYLKMSLLSTKRYMYWSSEHVTWASIDKDFIEKWNDIAKALDPLKEQIQLQLIEQIEENLEILYQYGESDGDFILKWNDIATTLDMLKQA